MEKHAGLGGPLALEEHVCYAIYAANLAIQRTYKPLLDSLGITYPQYLTLSLLWERDERSVSELAHRLDLEASTLTPMVKRLETAGLVTRDRNPRDERQVLVRLTETGEALKEKATCIPAALLSNSRLPMGDLMELNQLVRELRNRLVEKE